MTGRSPRAARVGEGIASFSPDRALELLKEMAGPDAVFRQHQLEAIEDLVARRRRVLVVQRTGWGKSGVYFIATRLLRDQGAGPTLLVSPLLALMRNQIEMGARLGVRSATINSANKGQWDEVEAAIRADEIDLLLVSPERLNNQKFRKEVLPSLTTRTGLLVIDEVHCVSDWGHDFRPDYRRLAGIVSSLPGNVPLLATTATANDRVVGDVQAQLGRDLRTYRGSLDRESLVLYAAQMASPADRYAWLATYVPKFPGSGVIYCLTKPDTELLAQWLNSQGITTLAYHGDSAEEERESTERALLEDRVKVVVATSALGMGFDKPNMAFVIHFQAPGSAIAYYQQVGRAGRAIERAFGILLTGSEDSQIQDYFIESAFPNEARANEVIRLLQGSSEPLSLNQILLSVNVRRSRLEAMLKILEVEGAVERVGAGWVRTGKRWAYDRERVDRVTAARRDEQAAMEEYQMTRGCLMEFLRRQLDDPEASPCGRCGNCRGRALPVELDPPLVRAARAFLGTRELAIEPRKRIPLGLAESTVIPADQLAERGRALSQYGHPGLGTLVAQGKYSDGSYADDLVVAADELFRRWRPNPAPRWVTCVPSLRHPGLVNELARRVAERIGLPFVEAVAKVKETAPQKEMENSFQQARNSFEAFAVSGEILRSPVLLIDDIVDSGWTLTAVASLLRKAGSGPVYPLALATAMSR
ncbi:MAG: RecQ family ATP-dependent DNA helicase [Dehalococcoidia bacterium]